jgi:hypothetical protein
MAELETDVARAVDDLRTRRSPPPGAKARVHALLEARLGGFDPDPDQGGPEPSGGGSSGAGIDGAFAAKVVGATTALTVGGLLVLKLSVLAVRSLSPAHAPAVAVGEPAVHAPAAELVEVPAEPEPEPSKEPATNEVELAAAPARVRSGPKPVLASQPSEPEPDISAELALIDAARQSATPEATIKQLHEHAQRFPGGVLRDEREALWAIASCQRNDFADARTRADELAARRPNSPLLDRVNRACPELEK